MIPKPGNHPAKRLVILLVTARLKRASDFLRKRIISIPDNTIAPKMSIAIGMSYFKDANRRHKFRRISPPRMGIYLLAGVRLTGLQAEGHKKIPPPKTRRRKYSRKYRQLTCKRCWDYLSPDQDKPAVAVVTLWRWSIERW